MPLGTTRSGCGRSSRHSYTSLCQRSSSLSLAFQKLASTLKRQRSLGRCSKASRCSKTCSAVELSYFIYVLEVAAPVKCWHRYLRKCRRRICNPVHILKNHLRWIQSAKACALLKPFAVEAALLLRVYLFLLQHVMLLLLHYYLLESFCLFVRHEL